MRSSLYIKLMAAFVLVVLSGTILTAVLANRTATGELDVFVSHAADRQARRIAPILNTYYSRVGSWEGVSEFFSRRLPEGPPGPRGSQGAARLRARIGILADHRVILADKERMVIFDSLDVLEGEVLDAPLIESSRPLVVNGGTAGFLVVGRTEDNSLERAFLSRVNRGILLAALGAGALALVVAAVLARQLVSPLRRLTRAAQGIASGDFSQRVEPSGEDEIGQLANTFNDMASKLQAGEEQRRRMIADIAHELRNPLSTMQGNLEGMIDGVLPMDTSQVATVYDQTVLLSRLVEDLRTLSLAQARELRLELEAADLGELVRGVVEDFRPLADGRNVTIEVRAISGRHDVRIDSLRISQVLANLLSNALRHTPEGGRVEVGITNGVPGVEVSVTDSGSGIGSDELPHVFERFYRADQSRTRSVGGSGLGLAIAKELVESHGGRIWADSTLGRGSTFAFSLPH
ncbi:MAG: HAMP domain-containing protein [Chloroflexi bacterium]|nr:HAMP domain-containing protein [Chloroflexota bacterium]